MSDRSRLPETESHTAHATAGGWAASGSFLGSILSGTLLGYLLDLWLDTRPWFIVIGIIAGSYAGFVTMWNLLKKMDEPERIRS
jgi:F0F1-type ATP synthase assembly protein I